MAVVKGALFSLQASGSLADAITFSRWKGIDYARQKVTPANPQSEAQTSVRSVFGFIYDFYKRAPAIAREPWIAAAVGRPLTAQNAIIKANVAALMSETDLANFVFSGGALGGLPPASIAVTPGNDELTVDLTAPAAPTGWTLVAAQVAAIADQDPHDPLTSAPVAGQDTTSTYQVVLTGLASGALYYVGGWLKWTTDTGNTAYSTALTDSGTTT